MKTYGEWRHSSTILKETEQLPPSAAEVKNMWYFI
jgi:hypothetical protein